MSKKATAGVRHQHSVSRPRMSAMHHVPTMMNSMGIQRRKKWKESLRTGHPGVLKSLHVRGERTRVSHAATVSVQTKKYLWADKCGGRSSEGGREIVPFVALLIVDDDDRRTRE